MPKLPTKLFGDVRAIYIFSELVLIKWLSLGRQNGKINQRKEIELEFVEIVKLLYAEGICI